jgi:hypothetical protein
VKSLLVKGWLNVNASKSMIILGANAKEVTSSAIANVIIHLLARTSN